MIATWILSTLMLLACLRKTKRFSPWKHQKTGGDNIVIAQQNSYLFSCLYCKSRLVNGKWRGAACKKRHWETTGWNIWREKNRRYAELSHVNRGDIFFFPNRRTTNLCINKHKGREGMFYKKSTSFTSTLKNWTSILGAAITLPSFSTGLVRT